MRPEICSFWEGPLGPVEKLCLASFAANNHPVTLYAYDEPAGLPKGVVWKDAAAIIPREGVFRYKGNRTIAVFADLFRLELMAREAGIWADCDVLCIKPFTGLGDYVFGFETPATWRNGFRAQVNNAVFRCPPGSPLLKALRSVFDPGAIPPGLPLWRLAEVKLRRAFGDPVPVHHMQFGATGPMPLNALIRRLGLLGHVQPREVFYPVAYEDTRRLIEKDETVAASITPKTLGIHIWNSALTGRGQKATLAAHPESLIGKALDTYRRQGLLE